MSLLAGLLALLIVMPLCLFPPGLLIVRRFGWGKLETFAGAVGTSGLLIYLFATVVYLTGVSWYVCWGYVALSIVAAILTRRDIHWLFRAAMIRRQTLAYGLLVLLATLMLAVIAHYSGGLWSGDWREHFERADFFLNRNAWDMKFIGLYYLPARPPMMNLVAAFFMALVGGKFELFQVVFAALNLLVLFSSIPLSVHFVRSAPRRVWIFFAVLALNPLVMQNATWSWTKLYSAFYVMLAIAFYLRGLGKHDPRRMAFAAAMMCAALLVHYSAGPFALVVAVHYLFVAYRRKRLLAEIGSAALVTVLLLSSWFSWSLVRYGTATTVASNTSVTDVKDLSAIENVLKIATNIVHTIVPHPLAVSRRTFMLDFEQPNPYGWVRDYFFELYQQNLILAFGLAGWLAIMVIIARGWRRANARTGFWFGMVVGTILIGIAVHGTSVDYGLTHVCLQPLVLIGLTVLAAGLPTLPSGLRAAVLVLMAADAVLGIVLQARIQSLSFAPWPDIPGGTSPERGFQIIPYTRGLLNVIAIQNSALRFQLGVKYLADAFIAVRFPLSVCIVTFLAGTVIVLGRCLRVGWVVTVLAAVVFVGGSRVVLRDRANGYDDLVPADLPSQPLFTHEEIEAYVAPFRRAVEADPDDVKARYQLGKAYYDLRQLTPAHEHLSYGFVIDPEYRPIRYLLLLLLRMHDHDVYEFQAGIAERYLRHPDDPVLQRALVRLRSEQAKPSR